MIRISGILPRILADKIEDSKDIVGGGNDIDITVIKDGKETMLKATFLGGRLWEIDELDDSAGLFPNHDISDTISFDELRKLLVMPFNLGQSRCIFSLNLLGKVKEKKNKLMKKASDTMRSVESYFTDDVSEEEAAEYIRKYYKGARLWGLEEYEGFTDSHYNDGKVFKVIFDVPSEKLSYVGCISKNGKDICFLDEDDYQWSPMYSFDDFDVAKDAFGHYNDIQYVESLGGNDGGDNNSINDQELASALDKKRRKRSRYNGLNVTGFKGDLQLSF